MASEQPVLEVSDLVKRFEHGTRMSRRARRVTHAVDGVSFSIGPAETLSLVGESGCGKSTVARLLMRLHQPSSGSVRFLGQEITGLTEKQLRPIRRQMQIVFQDPFASLDPRMTVQEIIAEPLRAHGLYGRDGRTYAGELLERVGLHARYRTRFPHQFSGGQRQRIGIARALALKPKLLILDEPVSALDVSTQAQVVNLLQDLQRDLGLAYLFIAHNLAVVRHISDRVAVMYLGRIVETGARDDIYDRPRHPYTKALLSAVPIDDPSMRDTRPPLPALGDLPNPSNPPSGCTFRTRCPKAQDLCARVQPPLEVDLLHSHSCACHFPEEDTVLTRSTINEL